MNYSADLLKYIKEKKIIVDKKYFAKKLKKSIVTINNYLAGVYPMSLDFYKSVCDYYDIPEPGTKPSSSSDKSQMLALLQELKDALQVNIKQAEKIKELEEEVRELKAKKK